MKKNHVRQLLNTEFRYTNRHRWRSTYDDDYPPECGIRFHKKMKALRELGLITIRKCDSGIDNMGREYCSYEYTLIPEKAELFLVRSKFYSLPRNIYKQEDWL